MTNKIEIFTREFLCSSAFLRLLFSSSNSLRAWLSFLSRSADSWCAFSRAEWRRWHSCTDASHFCLISSWFIANWRNSVFYEKKEKWKIWIYCTITHMQNAYSSFHHRKIVSSKKFKNFLPCSQIPRVCCSNLPRKIHWRERWCIAPARRE